MEFKVVSTREFSEEDLQWAVERALKYLDNGERLHAASRYAYLDMIDQNDDRELVADWVWCVFENAVTNEIEYRVKLHLFGG
jgi:hypothetical protein